MHHHATTDHKHYNGILCQAVRAKSVIGSIKPLCQRRFGTSDKCSSPNARSQRGLIFWRRVALVRVDFSILPELRPMTHLWPLHALVHSEVARVGVGEY
jgi:hypothetical protein